MNNRVILNNLEKPVEIAFRDKHNNMQLMTAIKKYIDANNEVLYANSPLYRLYFSDEKDRKPVYILAGVDKKYIEELIIKADVTKSSWKIVNDPFNIMMSLIIRQYTIDKEADLMKNALLYLALSLYSSLHVKYFRYLPNENIMSYTINNLSNKFLFKHYGVIVKALMHTALASHEKYKADLLKGSDIDIINYVMNLRTRLNNLMKNFTNEYRKNQLSKKYLNTEKDNMEEDNYFESDNVSLMIARVTSQTTHKFYSSELNDKLIRVSAKYSDTSPVTLKYALESIKDKEKKKVGELIQAILQVYLIDGKNSFESISSTRFVAYCVSIYSKSNTKDKNILLIKQLLDYFLVHNSNKYSETEREATRINYRKAFYMYIVLFIQSNQVHN